MRGAEPDVLRPGGAAPAALLLPALAAAVLVLGSGAPVGAQPSPLQPFEHGPAAVFDLPAELFEISGLAWHPDGRLLAHDDERGVVHSIDPASGRVVGRASLGRRDAVGDFEGVAAFGSDRVLVTTSAGRLIEVVPTSGATRAWDAGVSRVCEVEGLARLDDDRALLACKTLYQGSDPGALVLLRVDARGRGAAPELHLLVPSEALREADVPRPFLASGVEILPDGYVVTSARNRVVVFVDLLGRVRDVVELRRRDHEQPEGITIDPLGRVWIADEGGDGVGGRLTRYDPESTR